MEKLDLHQQIEQLKDECANAYVKGMEKGESFKFSKTILYLSLGMLIGMLTEWLLIGY